MDEPATGLQEQLDQLLQQAARVAVALDRANGTVVCTEMLAGRIVASLAHGAFFLLGGTRRRSTAQSGPEGPLATSVTSQQL
jgi:hypothetical protein